MRPDCFNVVFVSFSNERNEKYAVFHVMMNIGCNDKRLLFNGQYCIDDAKTSTVILLQCVGNTYPARVILMLRSIQVVNSCSRDHVILVITSSRLANGTHFNADRQFRQT